MKGPSKYGRGDTPKKRWCASLCVGVILITVFCVDIPVAALSNSNSSSLSPEVQSICDDFFAWTLRDAPMFATTAGVHTTDNILDDKSIASFDERLAIVEGYLADIKKLEPTLTKYEDIINIRILRYDLEIYQEGFRFKSFLMGGVNNMEGLQIELVRLLEYMPLRTLDHYNTMISRLQQIPLYCSQAIELMKEGVRVGVIMHQHSIKSVPSQIDIMVTAGPEDSPIYKKFFTNFPEDINEEQKITLQNKIKKVIKTEVNPAYEELKNYMISEYVTRPDIAATSLPDGDDLYKQLIKYHAGTNASAQEIHDIGVKEVGRISAIMGEIARETGNTSLSEFIVKIRDSPDSYYKSTDELIKNVEEIVRNVTAQGVPKIFNSLPADVRVKSDDSSSIAFYNSGNLDGSRLGHYYVGTKNLKGHIRYSMLSLTLHEASPGHHLQSEYARKSSMIPDFRNYKVGFRTYTNIPSEFPVYTSYGEGWGLYAETLGFDMDLYGNPLERFYHYSYEIFRACRLVVDTGMHALGWTRDQALDYMLEHTGMPRVFIEAEIDRYITWPGQALAYKMGQMRLANARARAEEQLGSNFNIKDFHDVVLDSVGPLEIVEEEVDRWIQKVLNADTR